jgi:hypothetical protein
METFNEWVKKKPWKAKRADVLRFWNGLKPNLPVMPTPVPKNHKGTRFDQDGIRITGSPDFINGVISRLKDMLQYYNNPSTKLDVEYRQIETKQGQPHARPIYVFYIHVVEAGGPKDTGLDRK